MSEIIISQEKHFLESGKDNFFILTEDEIEIKVFKGLYEYLHNMEEMADTEEVEMTKATLYQYHDWYNERFGKNHWSFPYFQSHYNLDHCIERFELSVI